MKYNYNKNPKTKKETKQETNIFPSWIVSSQLNKKFHVDIDYMVN